MSAAAPAAAAAAAPGVAGVGVAWPTLELPLMDDMHLHLRDGAVASALVAALPRTVARALVMPNLSPPVADAAALAAYRARLGAAAAAAAPPARMAPLMALYLTDATDAAAIDAALAAGAAAAKLYPAGATTHSAAGVRDVRGRAVASALARMAEVGLPLLVHGEVVDGAVDIFDREAAFLDRVAAPLAAAHPALRMVLEHITTAEAAAWVAAAGPNVAATITAHHLLYNRNALFDGGLRPHRYCLPVLKAEAHRLALLDAVRSGSPKFFAGTDSAPHPRGAKESCCGAAGMFTAHAAVELYATAFERAGMLSEPLLRRFLCESGADFYRLPRNADAWPRTRIQLRRETWRVPDSYSYGGAEVVPAMAGEDLLWRAYVVGEGEGEAEAERRA